MAAKKIVKKPKAARRKKVEAKSKGLGAKEMSASLDGLELAKLVESDGGTIVGSYKEPLGGKHVVIAALPIDIVEPTPYQRDRSEAHVKKLASAMERVGRQGVEQHELRIPGLRRPVFGEAMRPLFVEARGFEIGQSEADDLGRAGRLKRMVKFELPRGAYATVVLRALGQ